MGASRAPAGGFVVAGSGGRGGAAPSRLPCAGWAGVILSSGAVVASAGGTAPDPGVPAAGSGPGCSVSSLMWILLKGTWLVHTAARWASGPSRRLPQSSGRPYPCYGMSMAARQRAGAPGEVACPPHVTPDRHRVDEQDGRRVMDLARRRSAPAQGHGRSCARATRCDRGRRAEGRSRDRARGHRDPVADCGQAGRLSGQDRRPDRGQGHPEAGARRVRHPGSGVGQAAA